MPPPAHRSPTASTNSVSAPPDSSVSAAALPGDANADGTVDISDLAIVLTNYDKTGMTWSQGDFNGDGVGHQRPGQRPDQLRHDCRGVCDTRTVRRAGAVHSAVLTAAGLLSLFLCLEEAEVVDWGFGATTIDCLSGRQSRKRLFTARGASRALGTPIAQLSGPLAIAARVCHLLADYRHKGYARIRLCGYFQEIRLVRCHESGAADNAKGGRWRRSLRRLRFARRRIFPKVVGLGLPRARQILWVRIVTPSDSLSNDERTQQYLSCSGSTSAGCGDSSSRWSPTGPTPTTSPRRCGSACGSSSTATTRRRISAPGPGRSPTTRCSPSRRSSPVGANRSARSSWKDRRGGRRDLRRVGRRAAGAEGLFREAARRQARVVDPLLLRRARRLATSPPSRAGPATPRGRAMLRTRMALRDCVDEALQQEEGP